MCRLIALLALFCSACGVADQPESIRTVAAFEVPLPSAADKTDFIELLRAVAQAHGYHVDAATPDDLRRMSEVSPITLNAAVWRGDDDEIVASAMDFQDHIDRIWLTFDKGKDPPRFRDFRNDLMPRVQRRWPETASLPIMPNGSIPLASDLIRTASGYEVRPSARPRYEAGR